MCAIVTKISVIVLALLTAAPVVAQDQPQTEVTSSAVAEPPAWHPLGPVPVDQAGGGRRGYAIAGESADVAEPGASELSLHTVAANNFYREQTDPFSISLRDETHTVALGYRRGLKFGSFPRLEVGGQVQLAERDSGFLNGFISAFEGFAASVSGQQSAKNPLRALAPVTM